MKLNEATMQAVIPRFMSDDKTVKGLCAAADAIIAEIVKKLPLVNIRENLDMLTEEDLDYIAKIEKITWYNTTYIRTKKEKIIKNFEANCFILGTKMAVRNVTLEIFGENNGLSMEERRSILAYIQILQGIYEKLLMIMKKELKK